MIAVLLLVEVRGLTFVVRFVVTTIVKSRTGLVPAVCVKMLKDGE